MIEQKMLMFSKVNVNSLFSPFLPKQIDIQLKGNFEGLHQTIRLPPNLAYNRILFSREYRNWKFKQENKQCVFLWYSKSRSRELGFRPGVLCLHACQDNCPLVFLSQAAFLYFQSSLRWNAIMTLTRWRKISAERSSENPFETLNTLERKNQKKLELKNEN